MKLILRRKIYTKVAIKVLSSNSIRHKELSLIFSPDGVSPNNFLIDLTLRAISKAWSGVAIVSNPLLATVF